MYSNQNRFLKISSSAFGDNEVLLTKFTAYEMLSDSYTGQCDCFANTELDTAKLMGAVAQVDIILSDTLQRRFSGFISTVKLGANNAAGHIRYQIHFKSWFQFFGYQQASWRFENKSAVEIFTDICQRNGFTDYDLSGLNKPYPKLSHVVQHQENTEQFLNRLFATQGIYYRFVQTDSRLMMVLFDEFTALPQTIEYSNAHNQDIHIHDWRPIHRLQSHRITQTNYNHHTPRTNLTMSHLRQKTQPILGRDKFEQFSYPGNYQATTEGQAVVGRLAQGLESETLIINGQSNDLTFAPSSTFKLENPPRKDDTQTYALLSVTHIAHDYSTVGHEGHENELSQSYHNEFVCVPYSAQMQPQTAYQKPTLFGSESANIEGLVAGKLYANKQAEVRSQFFWQHDKNRIPSSYNMRVLQPIAGADWGMQFLPRAGDEVLVRYLHGDPDLPIILGSLHNAAKLPYFQLPNQQNQQGIVSRTVGSSDLTQSHQVIFNDTKSKELLQLVSSHDMNLAAANNYTLTVNRNFTHEVGKDHTLTTNQDYTVHAKTGINWSAGGSSLSITPDTITISGAKILLGGTGGQAGAAAVNKAAKAASGSNSAASIVSEVPTIDDAKAADAKDIHANCNNTPTPAPESILGKCEYYQFRHDDFVKRHANCGKHFNPPSYYLDYGLKYCEKFVVELYPKLSAEGKIWLPKAKLLLQQKLEQILRRSPNIELNDENFTSAAFDTHPDAYIDAGLEFLPFNDWLNILKTPDGETWLQLDSDKQVVIILWKINENVQVRMRNTNKKIYNECIQQNPNFGQYFNCNLLIEKRVY